MSLQADPDPGPGERLLSLDFFRGFTMFLLIGEATAIYERLIDPALHNPLIQTIGLQFHHHPWNGLRFWDLIQPFFMFIVGVAMPFSIGPARCSRPPTPRRAGAPTASERGRRCAARCRPSPSAGRSKTAWPPRR